MVRLTSLVALSLLVARAQASDWYVDANNGSNANSGVSTAQAWKTITSAVAQVPSSGLQTIHVAAGTYDAALGESLPINLRPDLQIVGAGSATLLRGAGTTIFRIYSVAGPNPTNFGPTTLIADLRTLGGAIGIEITSTLEAISPTVRGVEIELTTSYGILVSATSPSAGSASPTIERIEVHHCQEALHVIGRTNVTVRDAVLRNSTASGVYAVGAAGGTCALALARCQIIGNGTHGVFAPFGTDSTSVTFDDCSIFANTQNGWNAPPVASGSSTVGRTAVFRRCTVARNAIGLRGNAAISVFDSLALFDSIVWGNTDDVNFPVGATATNCDVGEVIAGANNFNADPSFVNFAIGDLRLKWASPCIDRAASSPAGTLDALGHARDVDGNLDAGEASDLGAFEFRPLELTGPVALGTLLQWELWGPQGNASTVYWTRAALAPLPTVTSFGELDLLPSLARVFNVTAVGALARAGFQRHIPNTAFLIGHTFAFQALTDNTAAPNGKAYTNPVQITVVP